MSLSAGSVFAILGARFNASGFNQFDRRFQQTVSRSEAASRRLESSQHRVGRAITGVATGAVGLLAGALASSVNEAAKFEQQMSKLGAVSGASARQMKQLRDQALEAGKTTKFSATQAAEAQTELAKGGLATSKILGGGMKAALSLAAAGNLDLAEAANTTANALNLFKLRGSDAGHVADALATAANKTTADVHDFAMALTQGGGAAKAAGLSFDQTVVALEALAQSGVKNSDAGTSLKTALVHLAAPTDKAAAVMKKLNLEFFDQSGKIRPLPAIADNLRHSLGGLTEQQRLAALQAIAGTDGFRALLALYDQGPTKLRALARATAEQGTAAEVAAKNQDNFKGKLEKLRGTVTTLGIEIGSALLPSLTAAAEKVTGVLSGLDGDAIGRGVLNGFRTVGDAAKDLYSTVKATDLDEALGSIDFGDVIGEIKSVAGAIRDMIGYAASAAAPIIRISDALGAFDAGNLKAVVGGIAAFKVASVVLGPLIAVAGAVRTIYLAFSTGTAAVGGALLLQRALAGIAANPIGAAAIAVGVLTAALIKASGAESADEAATRRNAAAKRDLKAAMDELEGKERDSVDARNAARSSTDRIVAGEKQLAALRKKGKQNTDEYRALENQVATDRAQHSRDIDAYTKALARENTEQQKSVDAAVKRTRTAREDLDAQKKRVDMLKEQDDRQGPQSAAAKEYAEQLDVLAKRQKAYDDAVQATTGALYKAGNAAIDKMRIDAGLQPITERNAEAFARLNQTLKGVPKEVRTKFLLTGSQNAIRDLDSLSRKLIDSAKTPAQREVRTRTVNEIFTKSDNAQEAVASFQALLSGVKKKTVVEILATTKGKDTIDALKTAVASVGNKRIAVTATAAQALQVIAQVKGQKIANKVARILGESGDAKSKIAAIRALGIPAKTARLLADASNALAGVSSVQGAIAALPASRTTTLTTVIRKVYEFLGSPTKGRATGRGPVGSEVALVNEGRGPEWIVNPSRGTAVRVAGDPQVVQLDPGDYVVPTEPAYRGRAMGFLSQIAKDMGLAAFAAGRGAQIRGKPTAPKLPVPSPYSAGAVDESAFAKKVDDERERYQKRKASIQKDESDAKELAPKIRDAQKDLAKVKAKPKNKRGKNELANAQKKLDNLESRRDKLKREAKQFREGTGDLSSLAELKKKWEEDQKNLGRLKAANREIDRLDKVQQTARDKMEIASKANDVSGYKAAKDTREATLKTLREKLEIALGIAKAADPKSSITAELDQRLTGIIAAGQDLGSSEFDPPKTKAEEAAESAAQRLADSGFTDAEKDRLDELQAAVDLAALTEPTDDDIAAETSRQAFLRDLLATVQGSPAEIARRGGASGISAIAQQLRASQQNLESLTKPGGSATNDNPDLQAQLDQQRERTRIAEDNSRALTQAVQAFGSSGDIGSGGFRDAFTAGRDGGVQIVYQSYVPPSPAEAQRLADYTAAGLGLQSGVTSPRQKVGL